MEHADLAQFNDPAKLMNQRTWEKFGELRAFLEEWADYTGVAPHIDKAYRAFYDR